MIVGVLVRVEDIEINVCKGKKFINIRLLGVDDVLKLILLIEMIFE